MTSAPQLFQQNKLRDVFAYDRQQAAEKVELIPVDQFQASPVDDLVAHVVSHFIREPLAIHEDRMTHDPQEVKIDVGPQIIGVRAEPCLVHATRVRVLIPFTGSPDLWRFTPSTFLTGAVPHGIIHEGPSVQTVEMVFDHPAYELPERLKEEVDRNLHLLREYLKFQRADLDAFHRELPKFVLGKINERRERLAKQSKLTDILALPLALNPDAPKLKPLNIQKRIIVPLAPAPKGGDAPEFGITDQHYDDILSIIRHVGRTFEATPETYVTFGEEDLRNNILAHLNGYYPGLPTGETFRKAGKTDIRIEAESRAAFVGECKIWKGQKTVAESLDQLLGYLTWRDCKTAVILFNKDIAGFSDLLIKVQPAVEKHARFKKTVSASEAGEWRFVLRSKDDDARLVHVHVFLLNLYNSAS
jgi:hypothetical protein